MLRSVFTKTLRDQWRSLVWWAVGLAWVVGVYVGGFRQYADAGLVGQKVPDFVGAIMGTTDFTAPASYVQGIVFTLLGPLLVILSAMSAGGRAVAGDEEDGMLDVLLAHPVGRARLVLERSAALAVHVAWLGLVVWVAVFAASAANDMGIPAGNIAAGAVGLALIGLVFGMLTLAVGALTGRRGLALGVTAAFALTAYLLNNLAPMVEGLENARKASPFYYYLGGSPLVEGFDAGGMAVLVGIAAVLAALAVWGLSRRDVRV